MISQSDKILADELVKSGIVAQEDVTKCIEDANNEDESLRSFLIRNGFISEQQALEALSSGLKLETVNLKDIEIDPLVIERIPVKFAQYYKFLPINVEGKTLTLVSAASLDVKIQDEIRVHLGLEPKVVLAKESEVIEALKIHYGLGADTIAKIKSQTQEEAPEQNVWIEDLEKETQDASVTKLVNQILLDAFKKRATDIHIEPYREIVRLRYRIDGVLIDANLPKEARQFLRPMLSRIKIMANLSIEEKRLPQDGSAVVKTKEQTLDLRVSTIPTPRGESMVIRLLPTKVMLYSLEKLGIGRENIRVMKKLVKKPHGIVLVTGPTGSGKTTTLYACLNEINNEEKKIITIEDPIEYEMEGITQIQVNHKVNLDFARGLRSVLRHDPDIIMVGEVRDLETAEIAIRTALTGHLVFSTLHTNDAASGITRLVDMGVEPFLVSSSVEAFVAQRLVRMICSHCREKITRTMLELREEIQESLGLRKRDDAKLFRGKGCDRCNQTGFLGRTAIYEVLVVTDEIREAILDKKRPDDIKDVAMKNGMRSLRQDGWMKVVEGVTSPEEVLEVTVKDRIVANHLNVNTKNLSKNNPKPNIVLQDSVEDVDDYNSRVYTRADVELKIRFQFVVQDPEHTEGYTTDGVERTSYSKDISAGGLRFRFTNPIEIGTLLALKIQLHENERSINCMAKVCRVVEDGPSYDIIAYFLDISSADRVKVDTFAKENVKNN